MPWPLDKKGEPFRIQCRGQPPAAAHQSFTERTGGDANQHALPGRPGTGDVAGLHVSAHLHVDSLGNPPQRQLAQGRQVAGTVKLLERALAEPRRMNFAFADPLQQFCRRQIHQLDLVGLVQHAVGDRLVHCYARDLGHDVLEAFQVLNVKRRIDIDACRTQFQDVLVALQMS